MSIDDKGRWVMSGFDQRPPMASFLPGIAGALGIPLWVFYVNRGQAIASFGIESKNAAIVEFQPANKAYQSVATQGFRTFVKVRGASGGETYYEPFNRFAPDASPKTQMRVGFNDLEIRDVNAALGLETCVTYFTLPTEDVAALVRKVVIRNTGSHGACGEVLDGLPAIIPFGVSNWLLKEMGNTMTAWMRAENLDAGIPFYRVQASVEDRPEVEEFEAGHFYLCFAQGDAGSKPLKPIVDPGVVFGGNTALTYPDRFLDGSLETLYREQQIATGKVPCGMFGTSFDLKPGEALTIYGIVGHARDVSLVNRKATTLTSAEYLDAKHAEAIALTDRLTATAATHTASKEFDLYCRQDFLDNVLRGGFPLLFDGKDRSHVYHVYARRHGDLERDYNFFSVTPEYYAQGNAAYRDINQNRRCDVLIEPGVEDQTVATFMNLIQLDGHNPLELRPSLFTLDAEACDAICARAGNDPRVRRMLEKPFTPGKVLQDIESYGIALDIEREQFVATLLRSARQENQAAFHEGYWVDHWTYNLDLIDNFLAVYPDRQEGFFFGNRSYTYYDSAFVVQPRSRKYVEVAGSVRQFGAVVQDDAKAEMIAARSELPNLVRTGDGQGDIYRTHLFGKLLALCAIKFSTLDPYGMGIEMEADKPGWYDALNGLPGLLGSSMSETHELKRLIDLLDGILGEEPTRKFTLAREMSDYLNGLAGALEAYTAVPDDFAYWDRVSTIRENHRLATKLGVSGAEVELGASDVQPILQAMGAKVEQGRARAVEMNGGLPPTYFVNEPTKWTVLTDADGTPKRNAKGQPLVRVEAFQPRPLPLFLEGMVKAVKLASSPKEAAELHAKVKKSDLFDKKLGMYKVNAPLASEPMQIGRTRAYTPGWLENESIFLHMHYKYLLALLTAGLYEEFWQEARRGLVPFFDPKVYGRSVLENSSFIASSAHPDASLHGRGFVARLSGATVEFMSMWSRATAGAKPFGMTDSGLALELTPALPGWLFDDAGLLSFSFMGNITVTYHNPDRRDVFPGGAVGIRRIVLENRGGEMMEVKGAQVGEPWASRIRGREVVRIDAHLA